MKILITGATAKLGGLVLDALFTRTAKENIAVMMRRDKGAEEFSNKGIEVRIGNYDDTASMVQAFKGIDKLYFISGPDLEGRLTQHKNVVAAALEANVGHVIYTSYSRKGGPEAHPLFTLAQGHIVAENAIKDSGIPYTLLLNNYYMEVIPLFVGENILQSKTIYFPAAHGKNGFIARNDIAELSAVILTTTGHEQKTYEVSGEQAYGFEEIAKLISEVSGITINYISPSEQDFEKALSGYGVPPALIELSSLSAKAIVAGEFDKISNTYERITGRKPTSMIKFLQHQYGDKNPDS
jgi:NAD(P)H dehydrogenase (quinone)